MKILEIKMDVNAWHLVGQQLEQRSITLLARTLSGRLALGGRLPGVSTRLKPTG
jgi:hypothetical protein